VGGPASNDSGGPWMGSVGPWMGSVALSTGFLFCFFCAINHGGQHKTTAKLICIYRSDYLMLPVTVK
jgi:hypothetical protein